MFGEITGMWWLFLITGIAWVIIALVVLRFDTTSLATPCWGWFFSSLA